MGVKKNNYGTYTAEFRLNGKKYKKNFDKSSEAKEWEAETRRLIKLGKDSHSINKKLLIKDLAQKWFDLHGHNLSSGNNVKYQLDSMCEAMGNPNIEQFSAHTFIEYRKKRLEKGTSENHANHELTYLKSMFNKLAKLGEWPLNNPLEHVSKVTQYDAPMRYLEVSEIKTLFSALNEGKYPETALIARLCIETGMRWNEANELRREALIINQNKIRLTKTKSGRSRVLSVTPDLMEELKTQSAFGRLFPVGRYNAFSNAIERAGIELPKGQNTHVLRHTFASHYMMNGGRLETLQRILGHSTILMTMKYAHLAPDYLNTMTELNPLEFNKLAA